MRQVLLTILLNDDENAAISSFKRISSNTDSPKLKLFRESLRLFLQHFVLKNTKNNMGGKIAGEKLMKMAKMADQTLSSINNTGGIF